MRAWGRVVFVCLAFLFSPTIACLADDSDTKLTPTEAETLFLDRLMRAESGGGNTRRTAPRPRLALSSFWGPRSWTSFAAISRPSRQEKRRRTFWR